MLRKAIRERKRREMKKKIVIPLFSYYGRKENDRNYFPRAHGFAIHPISADLKGDNGFKKN